MTFCSKSVEHELPQVGEVWLEVGKDFYRPGETPARQRLWLVVAELAATQVATRQVRLVNLETGRERNRGLWRFASTKFPWKRFASPEA